MLALDQRKFSSDFYLSSTRPLATYGLAGFDIVFLLRTVIVGDR